jgi:nucleoside-diphosphate-sugar epimerase
MSEQLQHTALLTGATGFIGSHLARTLLLKGWNLHIIVRPESDLTPLEAVTPLLHIHIHDGSIDQLCKIVADCSPDVVFHLASHFLVQYCAADIEALLQSNVLFATQLTEAMVQSGCGRLINSGTSWQHFENGAYNPVNFYAATKHAYEAMLAYYMATTPLHAITLKLFDSYGPHDPRPKLFTLLKHAAAEGITLAMSPGAQLIDLVYIEDIVQAYLLAADRLLAGEVCGHEKYAVSSGNPVPLRDIVELYSRVTGKKVSIQWGGRPYRQREVMIPWQNGTPLPLWKPEVDLTEGIKRLESVCHE